MTSHCHGEALSVLWTWFQYTYIGGLNSRKRKTSHSNRLHWWFSLPYIYPIFTLANTIVPINIYIFLILYSSRPTNTISRWEVDAVCRKLHSRSLWIARYHCCVWHNYPTRDFITECRAAEYNHDDSMMIAMKQYIPIQFYSDHKNKYSGIKLPQIMMVIHLTT